MHSDVSYEDATPPDRPFPPTHCSGVQSSSLLVGNNYGLSTSWKTTLSLWQYHIYCPRFRHLNWYWPVRAPLGKSVFYKKTSCITEKRFYKQANKISFQIISFIIVLPFKPTIPIVWHGIWLPCFRSCRSTWLHKCASCWIVVNTRWPLTSLHSYCLQIAIAATVYLAYI